jgi:hypothetical protein
VVGIDKERNGDVDCQLHTSQVQNNAPVGVSNLKLGALGGKIVVKENGS